MVLFILEKKSRKKYFLTFPRSQNPVSARAKKEADSKDNNVQGICQKRVPMQYLVITLSLEKVITILFLNLA